MDRLDQRREVDEAISYESLCSQFNREDVDEIAELIVDVLCTTRPTLRIGGEELPIAQVKDRFSSGVARSSSVNWSREVWARASASACAFRAAFLLAARVCAPLICSKTRSAAPVSCAASVPGVWGRGGALTADEKHRTASRPCGAYIGS